MKLVQKLLSTLSINFDCSDVMTTIEVLRDIRDYYSQEKCAELNDKICQCISELAKLRNSGVIK